MTERVQVGGLKIAKVLYELVKNKITPDIGVDAEAFWTSFENILNDLSPVNKQLLSKRDDLQAKIDNWHLEDKNQPLDHQAYKAFLQDIGYLLPNGEDFQITTENVDVEIARVAGPQLVVPVMNARYALNAANARWGSLYDALYGSNVIAKTGETKITDSYNPVRGKHVVDFSMEFLDQSVALTHGHHADAVQYSISDQQLNLSLIHI